MATKPVSMATKSLTESAKERYSAIKGIIAEKRAKIVEYEGKIEGLMSEIKAIRSESAPLLAYLKRAGIVEKGKRAKKETEAPPTTGEATNGGSEQA